MNAKQLVAAVAVFAAAGSVFAAGNDAYVEFGNANTVKTRAEVRAELAKAYADGQLQKPEFVEFTHVASTKSRDEVRNEATQAAKNQQARGTHFGS